MALLDFFTSKKKNPRKVLCPITQEKIDNSEGYLLTGDQIITSKKYWDKVMTEPETLSYSISHFNNEVTGTQMRTLIFEKYSSLPFPWIVSEGAMLFFDQADVKQSRCQAIDWWKENGENSDNKGITLTENELAYWRDYAILEAGREQIAARKASWR